MAYQEFKSLYYQSAELYAQEYQKRFSSEEAVKINFLIGERQAFFLQNAEVMTLAYQIAKLDKEIAKLCDELPGVAIDQYSKKCLIDEIVITNKIEGVHSSRKEIGEALDILETQSKSKGKRQRFLSLVNKYLKLISNEMLSLENCEDIRSIYDEVFLDEVVSEDPNNRPDGQIFRKESVSIHSETDRVIHNGLTPESKIIDATSSALQFLNDESIEELFRVCVFHYLIEYIHPFYDGNGRLGRFLLSYGISRVLSPLIAFRISETIKENIHAYYKAFKTCNDQRNLGDLTPFLLMQLEMILISMKELKKSLQQKLTTWEKYEKLIANQCDDYELLKLYSYLVQAALFSEKGISMAELQENLKKSNYMVKTLLNRIPQEMIVIQKKSNFKFYSLNLDILNQIMLEETLAKLS